MKSVIVALIVFGSLNAFAEIDNEKKDGPCHKVIEACKSAGYYKGGQKEKKGLYRDCWDNLVVGKTVKGVTVSPELLSACKTKWAQSKNKKKQ